MLVIENVSRSYGNNKVLNNVNVTLEPSSVYALIGPNGVGKTTLINMMANVLLPDSGTITLDDLPLDKKYNANKNVFVVLAGDRGLYWRVTARRNICYILGLKGIPKKIALERIQQRANEFDPSMNELLDKNIETLSFGQKKIVLLFTGYLSDARYLIIDEITEGLDVDTRRELALLIRTIAANGRSIIFASHDLEFARQTADRVIFLGKGYLSEEIKISESIDMYALYDELKQQRGC